MKRVADRMASLPNLSGCGFRVSCRTRWWRLCAGECPDDPKVSFQCAFDPPRFPAYEMMDGQDKWRDFHKLAMEADDHPNGLYMFETHEGSYLTPYMQYDIVGVLDKRVYSIEHVVPRSYMPFRGHPAENDPHGWIDSYVFANQKRSNQPLVLWDAPNIPTKFQGSYDIDGVDHCVPPLEQRARLARKWLYIRATYGGSEEGSIRPPSLAQSEHKQNILHLVDNNPPQAAEVRMDQLLRNASRGWGNPLIAHPEDARQLLYDVGWQRLVF